MKNNKKSLSAFQLILIITGSIVAAAGIVFAAVKLLKKYCPKLACHCCDEDDYEDWEFDDDMLDQLDDNEECDCCDCCKEADKAEKSEEEPAPAEATEDAE